MKKLKEARELHDFKNVWTSDENILFNDRSRNISLFKIIPDLVGNGQGLQKKYLLFYVYFWVHVGLCLIKESESLSFIFLF